MKVSIVTPSFNSEKTIRACIESVRGQQYENIEHIVIDGGSSDSTLDIVREYGVKYVSEADAGIYDAMNKGICLSSGEVVGILNSDDFLYDDMVVSSIVEKFKDSSCDICHGYILQVDADLKPICRVGGDFSVAKLKRKMKIAHPSVYVKHSVYKRFGSYSVGFKIAADYDFILRVWPRVNIAYVDKCIVGMRLGGASNSNVYRSCVESFAAQLLSRGGLLSSGVYLFINLAVSFVTPLARRFGVWGRTV